MKIWWTLIVFLILTGLCQNQVTEVDAASVPTNDPNKITGCITYIKTVSGGSTTYQCKTCASNFGTGWDLTLATLSNGQKRCIKKIFASEGCKTYGTPSDAVYSPTFNSYNPFIADETKDPNAYRKAYSCSECLSNQYVQVTYKTREYFFGEGFDFALKSPSHNQYIQNPYEITLMTVIKCQKITTLSTGCTYWDGYSFTYDLLNSKTSGNTKNYNFNSASSGATNLGYNFQTDLLKTPTCTTCMTGSSDALVTSSTRHYCKCNTNYVSAVGYNANLCALGINNCGSYSSLTQCSTCSTGYSLYNSQCIQCQCLLGYEINAGVCSLTGTINVATCAGAETKVTNCQTLCYSSSTYTCTKCLHGYRLESNQCKPNNCQTYVGQTEICATCKTGFKKPDGSQYCTQCDCNNGYTLSGGNCVLSQITVSTCSGLETVIPDCLVIDFTQNPRVCSQCKTGYRYEGGECKNNHCATTNCNQCQTGYLKPQGGSYCTACDCKKGYVASGSDCVPGDVTVTECSGSNGFISHCKIFYFVGTTVTCRQCDTGYTLDGNQCKSNACTGNNCNTCPTGYISPNNGGAACSECDCINGYVKSGNNCVQGNVVVAECSGSNGLIPHCAVFYFSGTTRICSTCDDGYRWEDNQCKSNNCKTSNCNQCQTGYVKPVGSNVCSACDCINGYVASGLTCIPGDVTVANCAGSQSLIPSCQVFYFVSTTSTCKTCASGYRLDSNQCKNNHCSVSDCSSCQTGYLKPNGGSYCTSCDCQNGYVADGQNCILGQILTSQCSALSDLIDNCKEIDFTGSEPTCTTCNSGYRLESGECVDDHCKTYTAGTNICQKCKRGYAFNNANVCVEVSCDCAQGYLFNSDDQCYYAGKYTRSDCPTGFAQFSGCAEVTVDDGVKTCTSCQTNYVFLSSGICYSDHCTQYSGSVCRTCETGYTLQQGACTGCDCKIGYTSSGFNQCSFSPYIQTSACPGVSSVIPNCKTLQINNGRYTCIECAFGFTNENGLCTQKVSNCATYSIYSQCTTCKNNYLLTQSNSCIPFVQFCQNYNNQKKTCQKCIEGYILSVATNGGQQCVKAPQNCATAGTQSGSCSKCKPGFTLVGSICTAIQQQTPCGTNEYRNKQGNCVSGSDPNCAAYDTDGVCATCKPNFKLNFNTNLCQSIKIENYQKCGTDTTNTQFIQLDGSCNKIDINCDPSGFQASGCYACKDGYYLFNSVCYKLIIENN